MKYDYHDYVKYDKMDQLLKKSRGTGIESLIAQKNCERWSI